jgi:hypothetical protein
VAERDEVDEVIRVEVADQHRIELARLDRPDESGERSLAEVEQDRRVSPANEVRGA